MKPSRQEIFRKFLGLKEVVPFFPQSDLALDLLVDEVESFMSDATHLDEWARDCVRLIAKFEGVPYLRAVYAIKHKPADGQYANVEVPGYSAEELESQYRAREMEENERRLESYRAARELAPAEDRAPLLLPGLAEVKSIPKPARKLETEQCFWCLRAAPADTWKFNQDRCPACNRSRPTLREREQHLEATKTRTRSESERQAEIEALERLLKK
jgi:hypothetical protein